MGLSLPYNATIPAVDARRRVLAHESGRAIVRLAREDVRLSHILTRPAIENAIRTIAAVGGSTNAVLHLLAIAGRLDIPLELTDFDRLSSNIPLLVDLQPSGKYLMEDFHYAGGLPAALKQIGALLHLDAPTVSGQTLGEIVGRAECYNEDVIRKADRPASTDSGIWVLYGNLCPGGAIMKPSAVGTTFRYHRGRAVVFETIEDYKAQMDDPNLGVDETSILVLKGCGPKGYPGMPEVGNMPLPRKVLAKGVKDMVRISDARMSGTAFGTVVLHVTPESEAGGPLAIVKTGDEIALDAPGRKLSLLLSEAEIEARLAEWRRTRPQQRYKRGYYRLYVDHVLQADRGCDLDFLVGKSGSTVDRESH
jgi:dihydroxy-acid dehydratase